MKRILWHSKNRLLSAALTLCMVLSLCSVMGNKVHATTTGDTIYSIHIYDSATSTTALNPTATIYGTAASNGIAEAFGRTLYFANGTPQSSGHAAISTISRYEGETIYINFGTEGYPKDKQYCIAYNYSSDGTTNTLTATNISTSLNGLTRFDIPYNYKNLIITALDNSKMHTGANSANNGSFLSALIINIQSRTSTINGKSLEALVTACGGEHAYTGTLISPFASVLQYVDIVSGNISATDRGIYTVTLKPKRAYKWSDLAEGAAYSERTFSWSIIQGTHPTPAAPTVTKTNNSITIINPVATQLYSIDGTNWYTAANLTNNSFTPLDEGTEYTVYTKIPANDNFKESDASSATVTTNVTITGKVTGDDLPATVTVGDTTVTTDADGNYSIVVPVGSCSISVLGKDGLQASTTTFSASKDTTNVPEISMSDTDKGKAKKFVDANLKDSSDKIITVTEENYQKILDTRDAWDELGAAGQTEVDNFLSESDTSYVSLSRQASSFALEAKRTALLNALDSYTDLSDDNKADYAEAINEIIDGAKDDLDDCTTLSDIDSLLANADLSGAKLLANANIDDEAIKAKTSINETHGLTSEDKTRLKAEIDTAAKAAKEAVDNATTEADVTSAVAYGKENMDAIVAKAKALAEAKLKARADVSNKAEEIKAAIEASENLSNEEKETYLTAVGDVVKKANTDFDNATTPNEVTAATKKALLALEKQLAKANVTNEANRVKAAIDALANLTEEEKETRKDAVATQATSDIDAKDTIDDIKPVVDTAYIDLAKLQVTATIEDEKQRAIALINSMANLTQEQKDTYLAEVEEKYEKWMGQLTIQKKISQM